MTESLIECGSGVRLQRRVPYRMSDGVTLYADHYLPAGDSPQPSLLMRQPYGRDIASTVVYAHPVWFARHGYHVVIQDVRGRGDSEGEFYPFRNERRDGAETIALLRAHPASNGSIDVPALHLSGWYDTYLSGSIAGFRALRKSAATARAREHQYLLAGPWLHIPWGDRIGDSSFGDAALFDTDALLLRWFNHWLKDSGGFIDEPRVRYFALGINQWLTADEWPEPDRSPCVTLYLHSNGRANSRKGDGRLTASPPTEEEPWDVFVYDPEVPVLAPGGAHAPSGAFNQSTAELGNNLLVYTTEPFVQPLHIFGDPAVTLFAQTSADSADFTIKLVRVLASGSAQFLAIGIARSTWAFPHGYARDTLHCWQFSIEPVSCVFAAGERLRVEIASSAFPLYDRNPSNEIPPHLASPHTWQRSTQCVLHTEKHPSTIRISVVNAEQAI